MESSQPSLATDSFSYSWLVNPRPNSMDETPSTGENDPRQTHNNFSFDVSISSTDEFDDHHVTSLPLVHADKLFSNGCLMPAFPSTTATPSTHSFPSACNQINSTSSSSPSFETSVSASLIRHQQQQQSIFPRKFSRFSRKFLHKYLGFLLPSCPIGAGPRRRRCKRVDDLDRRAHEVKSLSNTPETVSPRLSTASAYTNWSDYADTSIYEAILYCKKSSEQ